MRESRRHSYLPLQIVAMVGPLLLATPATGFDLELDLGLFNRFTVRRNEVERLLRFDPARGAFDTSSFQQPVDDDLYPSQLARASLAIEATRWLALGLQVDSGELRWRARWPATDQVSLQPLGVSAEVPVLSTREHRRVTANGQPIGDEAEETLLLRQAFVKLSAPRTNWLTLQAGRRDTEIASGLIYRDYGLGLELVADLELLKDWPWRLSAQLTIPTRGYRDNFDSPVITAQISYVISFLEELGLLVAYFRDRGDNFGQTMLPLLSELSVARADAQPQLHTAMTAALMQVASSSSADLLWLGLSGNKLVGDLMLSGTALVQLGSVELGNPLAQFAGALPFPVPPTDPVEVDTLAFALDLGARYLVTEGLALGGFFLLLSGEDNFFLTGRDPGRYGSFLSLVPYLTHTNIFFSGGMNETFSGRQTTTAGLGGRGVIAGGLSGDWEIRDDLVVGTTAALLASHKPSLNHGRLYGVELDLEGSYRVFDWLQVSLEYDILFCGDFFGQEAAIHRLLVGLDLTYSYESM
jgi:hypothetical protein